MYILLYLSIIEEKCIPNLSLIFGSGVFSPSSFALSEAFILSPRPPRVGELLGDDFLLPPGL